jgi:hypothetical protein
MKILVAGLAKTGTTGLLYLIINSLGEKPRILFEPKVSPENLVQETNDIVAKVLIGPDLNYLSFSGFDKKITIVRDFRDQIISALLYSQFHANYLHDKKSVKEVCKVLEAKEKKPSTVSIRDILSVIEKVSGKSVTFSDHLDRTQNFIKLFDEYAESITDGFIYKYEEFVSKNYSGLESFLGFSLSGSPKVPEMFSRVIRTKSSGNWRNWFTHEDVRNYKPILDPWLEKYTYDPEDWSLNPDPLIFPDHCSKYFMRLVEERLEKDPKRKKRTHPIRRSLLEIGRIQRARPRGVAGWAIGKNPNQPIRVSLIVDGREIDQTTADKPRPELKKRGFHATGLCGFFFRLGSDKSLKVGTEVSVIPVTDKFIIRNSPCVVVKADNKEMNG